VGLQRWSGFARLFEFVTRDDVEAILLLTVGTHDEVY
jgi:hypothetical protein